MRKKVIISPQNEALAEAAITSHAAKQLLGMALSGKRLEDVILFLLDNSDTASRLGLDRRRIIAARQGLEEISGLVKSKDKKYLALSRLKRIKEATEKTTKQKQAKEKKAHPNQ